MTKDQILARIDSLLGQCAQAGAGHAEPEQVLLGALTVMTAVYGDNSPQMQSLLRRRDDITKEHPGGGIMRKQNVVEAVQGALQNLRGELEAGLLASIERRVASDVLSDLIQLAREALKETTEGAKNVAAVLAAAAYEDTLRRIARQHAGIIGQDKLENVIGKLKDARLLVAPQLGIASGYLSFRNHALHAQWETIDRAAVQSVLGFVEELLLKHFS